MTPQAQETRQGEAAPVVQSQYLQPKLVMDTGATSISRPVPIITGADTAARFPNVVANGPNIDRPKQDKAKGNSVTLNDMKTTDIIAKKKVKKVKPQLELGVGHARPEKLNSVQVEERKKSVKHVPGSSQKAILQTTSAAPQKSILQVAAAPSSEKIN